MNASLQVLCVGGPPPDLSASPWGPFAVTRCSTLDEAAGHLRTRTPEALLLALPDAAPLVGWSALSHAVLDAALVAVLPGADAALATRLLQLGLQDVLPDLAPEPLARALRLAVERKALEQTARRAYATDLSTGLPNHTQLKEHMSHLLALREREPAPMALIVLRVEGLGRVGAALGAEAVNVLRRKAAVRLRAGLRASDVVAAIGNDTFAVLLAWIDEHASSRLVADKLVTALQQPFTVAGTSATLAVSVGVGDYPEHGRDADTLLRRAIGQASSTASVGRAGFANRVERGPSTAANDELPPG